MPDKSRFGDCSQPDQFIGAVGNRTYGSAGRDLEISPSQTGLSVRLETAPTGVRVATWRSLLPRRRSSSGCYQLCEISDDVQSRRNRI